MLKLNRSAASSRLSKLTSHIQPVSPTRTMATHQPSTLLTLNTGAKIPTIGFGTWQDKDAQESAVLEALKAGYRHIDTARIYGTEPAVGAAIRHSGIPRSEIFITTKLWNNSHHPDDVLPALDASLKDLGTDYIDLYLMHWPSPFKCGSAPFPRDASGKIEPGTADYLDTWRAMEACQKAGKARAIGVSNFSRGELDRLLGAAEIVPAAHQMELHPYLQQQGFADYHKQRGIHVQQYSPFGNSNEIYSKGQAMGKLIDDPVLVEVGRKYGKSGAQVALAWGVARGHSVLPKSKTSERIRANLEGDFRMAEEDLRKVDGVDRGLRFNDPSKGFQWDFFRDLEGKA